MNFLSGITLLALVSFTSFVYSVNELANDEAELHGRVSPHYNATFQWPIQFHSQLTGLLRFVELSGTQYIFFAFCMQVIGFPIYFILLASCFLGLVSLSLGMLFSCCTGQY